MKDPHLQKQLKDQIAARGALMRAKQTIVAKMEALAAKYKGDLKAASADPEMVSLIRRARDLETNLASNRVHSAEFIRASALKDVKVGTGAKSVPANAVSLKKEVK